jgi:hypothetical protein
MQKRADKVMQRSRAKLVCIAVCIVTAVLCALSRAPVLAVVHGIVAMVIWHLRFGRPLQSNDMDGLVVKLRDARLAEDAGPAMIGATVMQNIIAVPLSASRWAPTAIAFRDEMTVDRWRQLATALRHQSRPALASALITKIGRI